ncbi:MAG: hypothetical protein KF752_14455 [Pirellulaceae bacterium]|nr:hypothetical protein [Pirellulaceae bacterium]
MDAVTMDAVTIVGMAMVALATLFSLVGFVCAILIIVKMFQHNQTGLGIATLIGILVCGFGYLLALIFGWQNKQSWQLGKVMPAYTGSLILSFVLFGAGWVLMAPWVAREMQRIEQQNPGSDFDLDSQYGDDLDNGLAPPSFSEDS